MEAPFKVGDIVVANPNSGAYNFDLKDAYIIEAIQPNGGNGYMIIVNNRWWRTDAWRDIKEYGNAIQIAKAKLKGWL